MERGALVVRIEVAPPGASASGGGFLNNDESARAAARAFGYAMPETEAAARPEKSSFARGNAKK